MSDSKTSVSKASKNPDNLVTSYEQILNLEDAETYAKQAEDSMTMNTNSNQGSTIEDPDSNLPNRYLVSNREDVKFSQKTAKFQVRIIDGNGGMKNHEVKVCKPYNCSKCDKSFARLVDFTRHFELRHEDKSFQCNTTVHEKKKATRVCKLNSFPSKTQRWKLGNNKKLENKEGVWKSDDSWIFKTKGDDMIYIENTSKAKVLQVTSDGQVMLKVIEEGKAEQLWKKGEPDDEGYFTLQNSGEPKFLTAISGRSLEIKGIS